MAQRLVRVNCVKCKEPVSPNPGEFRGLEFPRICREAELHEGPGCNHCRQTGFRGRIGIYELMKMTSIIRELTFAQAPAQEIRRKARGSGMRKLLDDGILKVLKGTTTLEEVLSTCHAEVLMAAHEG